MFQLLPGNQTQSAFPIGVIASRSHCNPEGIPKDRPHGPRQRAPRSAPGKRRDWLTTDLEPILEPLFHPDSFGYRPGKSAIDAVGQSS